MAGENKTKSKNAVKEEEIRSLWRSKGLLDKLYEKRKKGEKYFLLDGPPYANYVPHVGHIRNTVYKDLYIRWAFMSGKNVLFQPGFDTHGLPIENMVEKKLGLKSKKDIQKLGISKFMKTCRESAALNKDLWMEVYDKLGSWYSWKEPYLTYNNSYIESAWWSFKKLWEKGMVYEGKKPVFWCPSCETALAGYEATDSYKNVTDPAIYIKFQLKDDPETSLLVYTTTPWTLPANCAVVVHPDKDYVKVKTKNHGNLIIAKARLPLLNELEVEYEVIEEFKGKKLDGLKYNPIIDVPSQKALLNNKNALRVYMSIPILKERVGSKIASKKGISTGDVFEDFVTVDEGTGLVHCAPGHGKTDNEVGKHYGIPEVSPLDDQCRFTEEVGKFKGMFVKDADHAIAEELHQTNRLLHYGTVEHSYPLCWRCKSPLIFRMSNQWFLKVDPIKEQMLKANEEVNWQPEFARERFAHWVSNADDWNFSRQRYWGIPIPIWKGKSGKTIVIGSFEELKKLSINQLPDDFDLHTVNDVKIKDPETGEILERINDIFDVWYDSGSAPYASLHYPFENKELFEEHYPIDRINESQDQIRGWFYSLMFCGVATFGKAPYKTVSMPGWVLDEKGEKMSKSLGNVVFAKDALEELGADALRFYYCWDISPQNTQKFSLETIRNDIRRFFTIWDNLVKLAKNLNVKFSREDLINNKQKINNEQGTALKPEDEWIISKYNNLVRNFKNNIETFNLHLAGREFSNFIMEDLSRTYIQFVRERIDNNDEIPARIITSTLLETAKLIASITPHFSEQVFLELRELSNDNAEESVHLELLPEHHEESINEALEEKMQKALDVIAAILSARDKAQIGVRWPLQKTIIDTNDEETIKAINELKELILTQTNIKELEIKEFKVEYDVKPDFQAFGRVFGEKTGDAIINFRNHEEEIIKSISVKKAITINNFEYNPEIFSLTKKVPEGYSAGEFKEGSAYIITTMNEELRAEGFSRELTRRIQQLRKESGLKKQDVIDAKIFAGELAESLKKYEESIKKKVGAENLELISKPAIDSEKYAISKDFKIKGLDFTISIRKKE